MTTPPKVEASKPPVPERGEVNSRSTAYDAEATLPLPRPEPAAAPAPAVPETAGGFGGTSRQSTPTAVRPLSEALAACSKILSDGGPVTIAASNGKGGIELPACYRGRRHLDCVVKAVLDEATTIDRDYSEIVRSKYSDLKDAKAICQINSATINNHFERAEGFDARAVALQEAFETNKSCVADVRTKLADVDLSAMQNSSELMKSMIDSISEPISQVSARQRDILRLVDGIEASRKAMETVRKIRSYICP